MKKNIPIVFSIQQESSEGLTWAEFSQTKWSEFNLFTWMDIRKIFKQYLLFSIQIIKSLTNALKLFIKKTFLLRWYMFQLDVGVELDFVWYDEVG